MRAKEIATHILREAEKLIRQKQYSRAIQTLGEIDVMSISPEDRALYNLIFVEANLNLGNNEVRDELNLALTYYRNSPDNERYALAKLLQGMLLQSTGQFTPARESFTEAYAAYARCENIRGQASAMNYLGYVFQRLGDFDSATANLKKCLQIYESEKDKINAAAVTINLAQVHRARGEIVESKELFARVRPMVPQVGDRRTCQYYLMSSIPDLLLHDFKSARGKMEKARPYLDEFIREKALYFEYTGWINNLEEDYDRALEALQRGLELSFEIAPASALISQTKRLMADAYIGLYEFEAARKFVDEALAVAVTLNERVEIAACYRVYAQLDAYAWKGTSAKEWFRKATDLFSMTGSRYELAVTRYLAATSGFYHTGERQALLYLAREYFEKENIEHYVSRINRELKHTTTGRSRPAHTNDAVPTIICHDPAMIHIVELARHIAPSNMSVLLTGPTGCGKDLLARYIHHHSGRPGRFVSVNAAAIPDNMVESELFGYTKGAYTGAASTTAGWIEEADGGTFYLNEIADSSAELQAKLLDVIENRRICRLGERQEREIDCRIIAATNHDLDKLIDKGRFRLDLYHRLNEIPINLPGLAERGDDVKYLLEHFLNAAGIKISTGADRAAFDRLASLFAARSWRGNVRELEIEVRRLTLLFRGDIARMVESTVNTLPSKEDETRAALDQAGWNRREAARLLGISESAVRHRIKAYNLTPDDKR
jgi:DNA-binding NtrC family response regulator/tetratricopeptide (TPR) repeat protein